MGAIRIADFDTWRPGYAGASVQYNLPGTATPISLFSDYALTVAASNPQVLDRLDKGGISYGMLVQPLYTAQPHEWVADGNDRSGRIDPHLSDLVGEDASKATALRLGGTTPVALDAWLARIIFAEDFGVLSATDSGVTDTTLTAAIAAAASAGGGVVIIPQGTWLFADLTLTAGVVLRGAGRDSTILQSALADKVISITGNRAGLRMLTLDGISQQVGSIGWYSVNQNEIVMDDVRVKRFDIGFFAKGGEHHRFRDFFCTNNLTAGQMYGDLDAGDSGLGGEFRHFSWQGGLVDQNINYGIRLSYVDAICAHIAFEDLGFEDNIGVALDINGARYISPKNCHWTGNTTNLAIADDDAANAENTVIGVHLLGGYMSGGAVTVEGLAKTIVFDQMELSAIAFTLTTPDNHIILRDCTEDDQITISGETEKLQRQTTARNAARSIGQTTTAVVTKAWGFKPDAGEVIFATAKIIGNQRDGENTAEYYVGVSAQRPGDELAYDAQVTNFTVGQILTGANTGATAVIIADVDGGGTGTLTLRRIVGTFDDNEQITDPLGGDALVNGTLTPQNAILLGAVTALRAAREDVGGWNATFAVNGLELEVQVTGAASTVVDWAVDVEYSIG